MLNYMENSEISEELLAQFNQNFFETHKQVLEKQKELKKLEKDTDYSEQEYKNIIRNFETEINLLTEVVFIYNLTFFHNQNDSDSNELLSSEEGQNDEEGFDEENSESFREFNEVHILFIFMN